MTVPPVYIVLFDGTDASESSKTNISEIKDIFQKHIPDNVKYFAGTNVRSANRFSRFVQKLASTEIHRDVSEAIAWMSGKQDGELYVFGYSRGAIAARYFAQCMTNVKFSKQYEIDPPSVIRAVDFLGLFDPVYGRFNPFARAPAHEVDAVHNLRIKSYVEVNAINEHRYIMKLISGKSTYFKWAKSRAASDAANLKNLEKTSSNIAAQTYYADRGRLGVRNFANPLENTGRYFEFMPGGHADVGGQNGCDVISSGSLLTVLLRAAEIGGNFRNVLPVDRLDDLIHFTDAAGEPVPNKSLSKFRRFLRMLTGLGWEYCQRQRTRKIL